MPFTAGLAIWKLAFQISPIIFVNGIAGPTPGSMIPIIVYTEAANFVTGLLSGTANIELDNFFAHYQPLPGSTLFAQEIGKYPFANQAVAANATIRQPLQLSMLMKCPARNVLGYPLKLPVMTNLQQVIDQHATLGGTYTIVTPAFPYTNGILLRVSDASDTETHQVQNAYQWDFEFPLLTLNQAQAAQNTLMGKLTAATSFSGPPAWSGLTSTVGVSGSLATPSIVPAAANLPGTVTAPFS